VKTLISGQVRNNMRNFISKYQLWLFILLTFVISWFPWYTGLAPEVLTLGPSLAAIILVLIISGRRGFVDLMRPFGRWRVSLKIWALAFLGMAAVYLISLGVYVLFGGNVPPFTMLREELRLIPLYFLVVLLPWNGPVGEEFGWRGYALPRLQKKYGPMIASLVLGTIWGIWHLPTFYAPQGVLSSMVSAVGLIIIIPYTLTTNDQSLFMTWIYNKSKGSALIAGIVVHAGTNFWAPVLLSDSSLVAAREGTHLPTIVPALYMAVVAGLVVAAFILVVATKAKLGYSGEHGIQSESTP
jgi:membrane protease YdiL (CAAX protease family)